MLQQTRVETAIPFYERFLARFPDVASLARAEEAEVLALWSGLGYYRRCRGLLAAAREIVARGGQLPRSARELERLPGIGPYTAAAIASIAFAVPVPVLDGNVERVICRYAARRAGAQRKGGRDELLAIAATLLDRQRPGDSNQALMELGATVCTPRAPRCPVCPLRSGCQARALGEAEGFPVAAKRPPVERVRQLVVFVEEAGRILLFRRSTSAGQLAGLWEFPAVELGSELEPEAQLGERFGGQWTLGEEIGRLRHAITRRSFAIEVRRGGYGCRPEVEADTVAESAAGAPLWEGARRPRKSGPEVRPRVPGGASPLAVAGALGWWARGAASGLPLTGVARKVLASTSGQPI